MDQLEQNDPKRLPLLCHDGEILSGRFQLQRRLTSWPLGERWHPEVRVILPSLLQTSHERKYFISAMQRGATTEFVGFDGNRAVVVFNPSLKIDIFDEMIKLHARGGVNGILNPDDLVLGNWLSAVPLFPLVTAYRYRSLYFDWLAPEIRDGGTRFDHRADIYSLGCLMEWRYGKTAVSHRAKAPHPDSRFRDVKELKEEWFKELSL